MPWSCLFSKVDLGLQLYIKESKIFLWNFLERSFLQSTTRRMLLIKLYRDILVKTFISPRLYQLHRNVLLLQIYQKYFSKPIKHISLKYWSTHFSSFSIVNSKRLATSLCKTRFFIYFLDLTLAYISRKKSNDLIERSLILANICSAAKIMVWRISKEQFFGHIRCAVFLVELGQFTIAGSCH